MDVIDELIACCEAWEPEVCVMGNVRAGEAAKALRGLRADLTMAGAFHKAAVAQRNSAWEEIERLRAELALAIDDCRAAQVERDNVRAAYITQIERLRAELETAKTDWQPIATAPTDRWVLVWRPHSMVPFIARYDAEYAAFEDTFGDHVYHATHWSPLPLPPEDSK